MSEKFKFKYLNGEYIEHLQSRVSNKLRQEYKGAKPKCSSKEIETNRSADLKVDVDRLCQVNQTSPEESCKPISKTSDSETIVVPLAPHRNVHQHSNALNVPTASLIQRQRTNPNPKPEMCTATAHVASTSSLRQPEFNAIETSLAKITCSQRAICSSIDSLVPNLLFKPLLETAMDDKRCRNRFDAFLRMFTRNYAYPIELMLTEIQSSKCLPSATFIYKINSIYNILHVAISAYAINARNYLDPNTPPKIVDLLNSIRQTTTVCIERMLFDEDDCIVQFLLDKIDGVQMQLQNIDIRKLDYNPNPLKFSANPREKQANRLSMYGFETHRTKSAKQNDHRVKVSNKDKEMTNDNVNVSIVPIMGVQQKSNLHHHHHTRHQQKWKSAKLSNGYDTISVEPKHNITQPAFASSDKFLDAKCKLNMNNASNTNNESDVIETTVYHRHPLNDRTVVDSTNRTASVLMSEKELFKCRNAKYSHIISRKDNLIKPQTNQLFGNDAQLNSDQKMRVHLEPSTEISTKKIQAKKKSAKLLVSYQSKGSTMVSRISDELNRAPIETFHKNLDFGERLFIEKFLALETTI